jgi:hypothetical protein
VSFFLRAGVAVTQGGSQVDALMPRWRGGIIVHKATRIFTMPPIPAENFRHLIKRHPGEPNLGNGTAAVPLKEAGSTIDVEISMSITTPGPLGKPDKFTVTNLSEGKPYAGGIHIKGMRMSTALALEDGHGKELAQSSNREERWESQQCMKFVVTILSSRVKCRFRGNRARMERNCSRGPRSVEMTLVLGLLKYM